MTSDISARSSDRRKSRAASALPVDIRLFFVSRSMFVLDIGCFSGWSGFIVLVDLAGVVLN